VKKNVFNSEIALKQPETRIKTPLTAEIYPEFEKDTQDASENTLILRLKRAEIELRKGILYQLN